MDNDEQGEIPAKDVKDLFRRAHIATVSFEHTMTAFAARMNKQASDIPFQLNSTRLHHLLPVLSSTSNFVQSSIRTRSCYTLRLTQSIIVASIRPVMSSHSLRSSNILVPN